MPDKIEENTGPESARTSRKRKPGRARRKKTADSNVLPAQAEGAPVQAPRKGARRRKNTSTLVKHVMGKIETTLDSETFKPSVGDFIRLLQLKSELKDTPTKEITVKWVDPDEEEESSKQ